jgi:hypothetical protein
MLFYVDEMRSNVGTSVVEHWLLNVKAGVRTQQAAVENNDNF